MLKRLTALLLLLAFGAGLANGVPLHSGGEECGMGESVGMMDCCKRARSAGDAPEVQAARLCCAVNCQQGGANGPASAPRVSAPQAAPTHPAAAPAPPPAVLNTLHAGRLLRPSHANESPPVYLLNLAFLI